MEKKKEWKPEDLKGKTVYDFCEDEKILKKVTDLDDPLSKDAKEYVKNFRPFIQAGLLVRLGIYLKDASFSAAAMVNADNLQKEYDEKMNKLRKENKGLIID